MHIIESENRGFYIQKNATDTNSRCIYLTAIELLRIAGFQATLRPMLEALFHRMLLLPATQHRHEPMKYVKEIFRNPERVVDMSVIVPTEKQANVYVGSDDMALFRLIMDAMQECAVASKTDASKAHVLESSVECLVALLGSLQKLITESGESIKLESEVVKAINSRYSALKDSDYKGPLTYQTAIRLPKVYREAVAELKKGHFDGSSDSDAENVDTAENVSVNSEETEGPEEENQYSSDNESKCTFNDSWRIPDGDYDRHHARDFAKIIAEDLVPKLLQLKNAVEIDEYLQEFSSNICKQNTSNFSDFDFNLTAINADGIYLATLSALLLGLQLTEAGHYENEEPVTIPLSEQQFVQSVQNSGILVCLSCSWLRELYQCVLVSNPLSHYRKSESSSNALIDLLYDAGGFGGEAWMTIWQKMQSVSRVKTQESDERIAAKKIARRLLTCCWESMLDILSTGLSVIKESRSGKLMKTLTKKPLINDKTPTVNKKALYISSLDGLHAAATLTNALNLQHLSGKILHLIATNACQNVGPKIPVSQALSMNVVLTGALELGAQNPDCWLPVFTICRHITKLEHALFSSQNSNHAVNNVPKKEAKNSEQDKTDDLKLKFGTYSTDDDEMA